MAQALENNRPTYVKIAFPGTDNPGVFDISDKLTFFKYFILEGGRGSQFEFEIINPDERVEELLKEQASFFYNDVSTDKPTQNRSYVLMEWGYVGEEGEPIKSKVHSGHIISLKYKFSSEPEKSIRFIVTDTPNYYSSYTEGVLFKETPLEVDGDIKKPSVLISELVEGLISRIPLVEGIVKLSDKTKQLLDVAASVNPLASNENYSTLTPLKGTQFYTVEGLLTMLGFRTGTSDENDYSAGKTGTSMQSDAGEAKPNEPSPQQTSDSLAPTPAVVATTPPDKDESANIPLTAADVENSTAGTVTTSKENIIMQGDSVNGYAVQINGETTKTTTQGSVKVSATREGLCNDIVTAAMAANDAVVKAHSQESESSEPETPSESGPPPRMVKFISPQGESILTTLRYFFHKVSDFLASPAEDMEMHIISDTDMYSRDTRIEEALRIINESIKSTDPKMLTRAVIAVGNSTESYFEQVSSKFDNGSSLKPATATDFNIASFPQVQMSNPENIKLDYGGKDSIISSFQSDLELGYMLKSLVKAATPNVISDNYSFLFNKEALLSISNTLGEASNETTNHKKERRGNLDQWNEKTNSVKTISTADFKYLERTLDLITNFKDFVEAKHLDTVLSEEEKSSFLRLVDRLQVIDSYRELLGIDDSIAAYFVSPGTQFDNVNGTSVMGRLLSNHATNEGETQNLAFAIKLQTLGIPELDSSINIAGGRFDFKRKFYFKAHDISRERFSNQEELHWLTGQYQLRSLSHTITPQNGYVTNMELLRSAY